MAASLLGDERHREHAASSGNVQHSTVIWRYKTVTQLYLLRCHHHRSKPVFAQPGVDLQIGFRDAVDHGPFSARRFRITLFLQSSGATSASAGRAEGLTASFWRTKACYFASPPAARRVSAAATMALKRGSSCRKARSGSAFACGKNVALIVSNSGPSISRAASVSCR